jgi:hypothetical protein
MAGMGAGGSAEHDAAGVLAEAARPVLSAPRLRFA